MRLHVEFISSVSPEGIYHFCMAFVPALTGGHKPLVGVREGMILNMAQLPSSCCGKLVALGVGLDDLLGPLPTPNAL